MGNSPNNNSKELSKQGDLSKLLSCYLQEKDNTFTVLNSNNKQITKSNLSKVLNSKSILNNTKLLSFKVFVQYNSKSLNVNDYQTLLASKLINDKAMVQSHLIEANKLLKKDLQIYQKKLTIQTNSITSYQQSDIVPTILNQKNDSLQSNTYCLNHTQISHYSNNKNQNTDLNESEFVRDNHNKTFDDMNLQEYLNEETRSIRRSISMRHDTSVKDKSSDIDMDNKYNANVSESNNKKYKKKLSIQSSNKANSSTKKTKDKTRYNTITYNSLYENEYFYNKDDADNKSKNTIENSKAPIETEYNLNLLKNRYITANPKSTSYQSFRSGIKGKNGNNSTSNNTQKNTFVIRNTTLAKKQLSPTLNSNKDSFIKRLKQEKKEMQGSLSIGQANKSQLLYTPKTSRVTSPKTSFTSKPVTSYSSRNISYIANQQNIKQGNQVFNIKIDLRELMKEEDEEEKKDGHNNDDGENKDNIDIKMNKDNGLSDNDHNNTLEINTNTLSNPIPTIVERKKDYHSSKNERYSNDKSSLEGLIITHQKVDVNGKINI